MASLYASPPPRTADRFALASTYGGPLSPPGTILPSAGYGYLQQPQFGSVPQTAAFPPPTLGPSATFGATPAFRGAPAATALSPGRLDVAPTGALTAAPAAAEAGGGLTTAQGIGIGLTGLGVASGIVGAIKATKAAKEQRVEIAKQAGLARQSVRGEVERFREAGLSQVARGAQARGLYGSGLQARSQAAVSQRAEEILTDRLVAISQQEQALLAQVPTTNEVWSGVLGRAAGFAVGVGATLLTAGAAAPLIPLTTQAGGMAGEAIGGRA